MSTALPADTYSLVADIGGTNTRVALCEGRTLLPDTVRKFRNADYAGLETVLTEYLASSGAPDCAGACVAVAGPVRDGRATLTNLDWSIDAKMLARAAQAEHVAILNDLQAQGHALGRMAEGTLTQVVEGREAAEDAARLVIGVGTGFNAAPVHETGRNRIVPPSEAGHANLPIRNETDLRLSSFVGTAHGFPAIEDVLSGRGLERLYSWHCQEAGTPSEKAAADIMAACADGSDPNATAAVQSFVRLLGAVAGDLSLVNLPFGGVFLIGGVARAMAPYFGQFGFEQAFRDKGRFAGFMANFPVWLVEDDFAALTGCAAHLAELQSA